MVAVIAIICECLGVYQSMYIMYLADYIRSEDEEWTRGLWLVAIFISMNFTVIILRNNYIQFGY